MSIYIYYVLYIQHNPQHNSSFHFLHVFFPLWAITSPLQCGAPPVLSWFIVPTIDITPSSTLDIGLINELSYHKSASISYKSHETHIFLWFSHGFPMVFPRLFPVASRSNRRPRLSLPVAPWPMTLVLLTLKLSPSTPSTSEAVLPITPGGWMGYQYGVFQNNII